MFKFIGPLAAAVALTAAIASTPHTASAAQLPSNSAGFVQANGSIGAGAGFTGQHTGKGTYVVTYPNSTGFFSVPIVTVSPFGVNGHVVTGVVSSLSASNGGAQFTIQLSDKVNRLQLEDNAFMFVLLES